MRIYVVLALCLIFSCCLSLVHAEDVSSNFQGAINKLTTSLYPKNKNIASVRGIIQSYCDVVLSSPAFTQDGFVYTAKHSTFVYLLCNHLDSSVDDRMIPFFRDEKVFKLSSWKSLGIEDIYSRREDDRRKYSPDFCSANTNLNRCTISTYIPLLYQKIINDYINLKQSNLYGFLPNVSADESANAFSRSYFNGLEICSQDDDRDYTATCKILKGHIVDAKKILADVQIFDLPTFFSLASAKGSCDVGDDTFNLLFCGLYQETDYSLQRFLNLVYNESFYYRLFAQYYLWMITVKPEMLNVPFIYGSSVIVHKTEIISNELFWSQEALSLSLRMMRDAYTTFPLHIGFLMYQEDLSNLFFPLGRLYTPISQLSDYTLRNVQKKQ